MSSTTPTTPPFGVPSLASSTPWLPTLPLFVPPPCLHSKERLLRPVRIGSLIVQGRSCGKGIVLGDEILHLPRCRGFLGQILQPQELAQQIQRDAG
ncbi:hypothetical protein SMAC4_14154 [Sordaria macrospora]|uniref:uncharacterized protein n=1 Tax=Sordaria macrospora TaxID=5147 RepID=UPI002B2B011C|nr:hypothetical protein SMAC4_14154 [Sordaria macrospora]